jgi:hypothetical protein
MKKTSSEKSRDTVPLRKAFDVCSHSILLEKLKKMGIQDIAHSWFKNYLSGRSQRVDINGVFSDPLNIDISVIQGSILGPILFLHCKFGSRQYQI